MIHLLYQHINEISTIKNAAPKDGAKLSLFCRQMQVKLTVIIQFCRVTHVNPVEMHLHTSIERNLLRAEIKRVFLGGIDSLIQLIPSVNIGVVYCKHAEKSVRLLIRIFGDNARRRH